MLKDKVCLWCISKRKGLEQLKSPRTETFEGREEEAEDWTQERGEEHKFQWKKLDRLCMEKVHFAVAVVCSV